MTNPIDTIREALRVFYRDATGFHDEYRDALAALTQVEQQLALANSTDLKLADKVLRDREALTVAAETALADLRRQMEEQRKQGNWPLAKVIGERDALANALRDFEAAVRVYDVMLNEPAAEGLMSAEDYSAYLRGAWLGVEEAAVVARAALEKHG